MLALSEIHGAEHIAERALAGELNRPTGNGGRRVGDDYLPPCNGEPDLENWLANRVSEQSGGEFLDG